jgi:putative membrane protein
MKTYDRYHYFLFTAFLIFWIWGAINPVNRLDWLIENGLIFCSVAAIIYIGNYFKFSKLSYTLIVIFLIMHLFGAHYTYGNVPLGYWIGKIMHTDRNMYDRFVHFSFGLLIFYPIREIFLRIAKVRGFWSYYLPFDVIMSFSAMYEILEWTSTWYHDPKVIDLFVGNIHDVWDSQEDMAMALTGAVIALLILAYWNWEHRSDFWAKIRSSLKPD